MILWRTLCKGDKSVVMIVALKGRFLLQILQGNFVLITVLARNPLEAAYGRSQEKLLTSCKVDPHLYHLEQVL